MAVHCSRYPLALIFYPFHTANEIWKTWDRRSDFGLRLWYLEGNTKSSALKAHEGPIQLCGP